MWTGLANNASLKIVKYVHQTIHAGLAIQAISSQEKYVSIHALMVNILVKTS